MGASVNRPLNLRSHVKVMGTDGQLKVRPRLLMRSLISTATAFPKWLSAGYRLEPWPKQI